MKVIFLDVDGVINSSSFLESNPGECVDPTNMVLFKKLVEESEATVVMSSGWRLWFNNDMEPINGDSHMLDAKLKEYGIQVVMKTPDFSDDEIRQKRTFSHVKGKEILTWLEDHDEVSDFVVLDDLLLREDYINSKLVRTNPEVGLTNEDIEKALTILNVRH